MLQGTNRARKRDKTVVSCTFCRARKLRCDRQSPCGGCLKRGRAEDCIYTSSAQERRDAVDYRPYAKVQHARQKVARLERNVTLLRDQMRGIDQGSSRCQPNEIPTSSTPSVDSQVSDRVGKLDLEGDQDIYTGSTHWATILEDIQSLKDELISDLDSDIATTPGTISSDTGLTVDPKAPSVSLLSSSPLLSKAQILAEVPPRKVVDRHVSHFFNSFDFAGCLVYRKRFSAEYANFWEAPSEASTAWLALLFAIMAVSAFLQQYEAEPNTHHHMEIQQTLEMYRSMTVHSLVAANYLRPNRNIMAALTLHFAVNHNSNVDSNIENWMLIGIVIRVALRMGLHRDPSHWPNFPPLEAEFRRRMWITLYHMDFFTSTQLGLPRIIKNSQCDTRAPMHLDDDDLSLDMASLPSERPVTGSTALSNVIHRHPIIQIAAEVYDATEAGPPAPEVIAALNNKLQQTITALPEAFRYRPLEESIGDSPHTVLHRMVMDILTHKAIYLLHRRSFMKASSSASGVGGPDAAAESNRLCIDAALRILEHQRRIADEIQPGGIMFSIRWKVVSSLNHEFLQATMMLCLALNRTSGQGTTAGAGTIALHRTEDVVHALTVAKELWESISARSVEARRAVAAIASVLREDVQYSGPAMARTTTSAAGESSSRHEQPNGCVGAEQLAPVSIEMPIGSNFDLSQESLFGEDLSSFAMTDASTFGNLWDDLFTDPMGEGWM